ncbi:hypothetical protein [Agromyces badenianii]|uniref:hypothetical protein n=1 Tax=Agromyces badenianii TaxID=2080742 RepID=UPI000D59EACB|nr:hypothetical protein [Agromyces badenianii]PWC03633.1 hypothetical protein DCE94_11520 [Agromyces badenianii]
MDDWVDDAVQRGAPQALGGEPVAAGEAVALARAAIVAGQSGRRRLSRPGRLIGGAALSLGILGLGVTAAAAAPAVIEWFGWTPDIVAERTFDFGRNDLGLCTVYIGAEPVYRDVDVTDEEADRRTEEARRFLMEHDWRPLLDSITESDIQAEYTRMAIQRSEPMDDGTMPPSATMSGAATQVIGDRISEAFQKGGYLREGVALESGAGPCSDATEGPTR